ncbi:MAG: hypothetical protein IAE77_12740 [Prosthecobacter sp.]|uniref:hypothetical protein n=1 Tax=Prosthecobacter sp. TaxID=1965333 RepID=UPI001A0C9C54|nr:hypothetical protein [Prosthecobacter sp.]MBE2284316.1 hypothetical protein [Prosthecobacter sp.]
MKCIAFLTLVSLNGALAQSSGGPYSITAASLDPAGGRSATASYRQDSNLSATASQISSSAAYQGAAGFSSMLRDAVSLLALPGTVPEAVATQLTLRQVLDDGTQTAVSAALATWSVNSGPASVSATGLLSAQAVSTNTDATLQITFSGVSAPSTITIQNTVADNFGLYAADGLDDGWQVQYFGPNNPLAAPGVDADGDGQTNLFEFTAGLVPNSRASRFVFSLEGVPGQPTQKRMVFQPAINGRTFTLLKSSTLLPGSWQTVPGAVVVGNDGTQTLTDPSAGTSRAFYQVQINVP